ncbi:MAG: hypothetical protein IKN81_01130 [Oscillospiraceae bacterium]|nr:hypothetical protein [Oscillospiraceae bacterium]
MELLEDSVLAALAAIGLVTVLFLLISGLPRRGAAAEAFAVVPCRAGEGAALERAVHALERSRYDCGGFCRIVILDRGMDEDTRRTAVLLCHESYDVTICNNLSEFYESE